MVGIDQRSRDRRSFSLIVTLFHCRSDEFYECVARHNILTEYHPSATAKMGSKDDPMAVTDPRLRY